MEREWHLKWWLSVRVAPVALIVSLIALFRLQIQISPRPIVAAPPLHRLQLRQHVCEPKTNVLFLKTRKTGSSALQNILMRFGWSRELTFMLPYDDNLLGYPQPFDYKYIAGVPGHKYFNLLCHHIVYDSQAIKNIMPPTTFRISILRNPIKQIMSVFYFSDIQHYLSIVDFDQYLGNARLYFEHYINWRHNLRNPNMYDFGLSWQQMDNRTAISNTLETIERDFDFILIHEYFYESLVLLRQKLCWEWDDMVVFRVNSLKKSYSTHLSPEKLSILKHWIRADIELYNIYLIKFKSQLKAYGVEKMKEDVNYLKRRTEEWFHFCIQGEAEKDDIQDPDMKAWHNSSMGYILNKSARMNETCRHLTMSEMAFTARIQDKQYGRSRPQKVW